MFRSYKLGVASRSTLLMRRRRTGLVGIGISASHERKIKQKKKTSECLLFSNDFLTLTANKSFEKENK